ncbi:MAG: AmmeMemoRadiSam system radical SAM enzyme [Candidatus Omnitrophota bacterium]|nr:MAG: AmmeMemoRadiSam system radical SAM enzyme [Candidatus Omnitrophota bacterium]
MKKESMHCEILEAGKVRCLLCPHVCLLKKGEVGRCGVRQNEYGRLYSLIYGEVTSCALDPIEKKPLYHFHPGEHILSLGTKGCNLKCPWCQNWAISQEYASCPTEKLSPQEAVSRAKELNSFGIAYTYNEPFIWYEFVYDTALLGHKEGLKNVLVTNGYVNQKPLEEIISLIDAMNIDVKSMDDNFYKKYCDGRLSPVLRTAEFSAARCHVEITNLIIPTLNDSRENFQKLTDWVAEKLGKDTPLHFSRYFPAYKMDIPPTPIETLKAAEEIARKKLRYVYLGNT